MRTNTTTTTGHRLTRLEQIPPRDPTTRYPTRARWVCECSEAGEVWARWGRQTDASMAAHAAHAAVARQSARVGAFAPLWLEGGRALLDGRHCTITITDRPGAVLVQLDDAGDPFLERLNELSDVIWNSPGPPALRIFALVGNG